MLTITPQKVLPSSASENNNNSNKVKLFYTVLTSSIGRQVKTDLFITHTAYTEIGVRGVLAN